MTEQQPLKISDLEETLKQTRQWVDDWHQNLRQTHKLTDYKLLGLDGDINIAGGHGFVQIDGSKYFWSVTHDALNEWEKISVLQFNQVEINFNQPVIARVIYHARHFETISALSFGWRYTNNEVIYESLEKPWGPIDRYYKTTHPGIIVPAPEEILDDRSYTQTLSSHFYYDGSRINEWSTNIKYAKHDQRIHDDNGWRDGDRTYNMIPDLQSFAHHKAKLPLIET